MFHDVYAIDDYDELIEHLTHINQSTVESAWGKNEEGVTYDDLYFSADSTRLGRTSKVCPDPLDDATIAETDMIGDFAIVTMEYQDSCWTDAAYSPTDFPARVGILTSTQGNTTTFAMHLPSIRRKSVTNSLRAIGIFTSSLCT